MARAGRLLRIAGVVLAALAFVLAGLAFFLNTSAGGAVIAGYVARTVSSPGSNVTIGKVEGALSGSPAVRDVALAECVFEQRGELCELGIAARDAERVAPDQRQVGEVLGLAVAVPEPAEDAEYLDVSLQADQVEPAPEDRGALLGRLLRPGRRRRLSADRYPGTG